MMNGIFLWQAEVADTTSAGYKIGYQIGSWLPFVILAGLMIALIIQASRNSTKGPGN